MMKKTVILLLWCLLLAGRSEAILRGSGGAGPCSPIYGSELQLDANAAEPDASDTDATTGLTSSGLLTFESTTTAPSLGTYHINAVSDTANDRFYDDLTGLSDGTLYKLSFDSRHNGTGEACSCRVANTSSSSDRIRVIDLDSADTTYSESTVFFVKNADLDYLQCVFAGTTGGIYFDNYSIKAATTPCLGSELHTSANAASLSNEANDTAGFTNSGIDTFESVSTDSPHDGTYHLHLYEIDTPTSSARIYMDIGTLFSLQEGTKYLLTFWAKHAGTASATWRVGFSTSTSTIDNGKVLGEIEASETTYTQIGASFVYTSGSHRYFTIMEANASNNGELWVDGLSIKEVTVE